MAPLSVLDSHIHLWPEHMSNEQGHAWMTPGMPLAKEHILSQYYAASKQDGSSEQDFEVTGVVYVETDVRYDQPSGDVKDWAKGPLDEIKFLRDIVEAKYGERDSKMLLAIVAWAPMDQSTEVLEEWLRLAEETAGSETWRRVKGFRFLLQAILDEEKFKTLVSSQHFINNLKLLGKRGFAFDVGVDQHSGGIWQLELISRAMTTAHVDVPDDEKVTFVLNHLCKPDFIPNGPDFDRWSKIIEHMSALPNTYMKLSGAFSELPEGLSDTASIATHVRPWVEHVFGSFGPSRVMFGSDWPVCNVRGPAGEDSWVVWKDVVTLLVDHNSLRLNDDHKASVWKGTAEKAYKIG
ncbi:L-rhamnono-gamma-lactonase [Pseudocercospora fuligena]|uniref:L-rhamnono-gamma-lactonase n=1 Tax=Pseudocercospora fuligena TaxID=685502 RepID=A0A8H6RCS9_9PEZI|nr:L-rhamnono-gamma-lactonase [Pseudocercospora fuligena]